MKRFLLGGLVWYGMMAAGVEFQMPRHGYSIDLPAVWPRLCPETVAKIGAQATREQVGLSEEAIGEFEQLAGDEEVAFFLIHLGEEYSDNLHVVCFESSDFPNMADPEAVKREFEGGYTFVYQSEAKVLELATWEPGDGRRALTVLIDFPELKLRQRQYIVEREPDVMLAFTLTAHPDRFAELDPMLREAMPSLRIFPVDADAEPVSEEK